MRPDVAIIGAGIVGTAAAAFLAGAGATVRLYERAGIAAGASGRNSGVVQHPLDPVLVGLYRETVDLYRELEAATGRRFALPRDPSGLLYVGRDPVAVRARRDALQAALPALAPSFVDGPDLRSLEPSLAAGLAAVRLEVGFPVAPAAAARAYAWLAASLGAEVRPAAEAVPVFDGDRAIGVRAAGVVDLAGAVVVAAGPWSPALVDPTGSWRPIRPLWGVVVTIGLERPPRHVLEQADIATEPEDAGAAGVNEAVEFSLVTAGGTSSAGSTFLPAEPEPTAWANRIIRTGATFVPEIARAPVLGYRSCARPLARDGRPLVGPVPGRPGLFVAAGHGAWGISTGPASARHLADAILGRPPATAGLDAACDPSRFGQRIV